MQRYSGVADQSVPFAAYVTGTGVPVTVTSATAGLSLWYRRGTTGAKVAITPIGDLASLETAHTDKAILIIEGAEHRLDLPDAAFAAGVQSIEWGGTATDITIDGGTADLVILSAAQWSKFAAICDGTPGGAVVDDNDPDPLATAFETDLAEASNDHYNGAFCVFYTGVLTGQSRKISDYDGTTKVLTVAAAFTEAPAAGDDFLIIGRSE